MKNETMKRTFSSPTWCYQIRNLTYPMEEVVTYDYNISDRHAELNSAHWGNNVTNK